MVDRRWVIRVLGAVFFLTGLLPVTAVAVEITLTIQSAFGKGELPVELLKAFVAEAEKKGDDELKIKVVASPHIVPVELLLKATARGGVDMMQGPGILWRDIIPVADIEFGLPLAYKIKGETGFERQAELIRKYLFKSGVVEVLREAYARHGVYLLDFHTYGPAPYVLSIEPLKTLADMKGKKIRTGGYTPLFLNGVGMQGVPISTKGTYKALKEAAVDAAEADLNELMNRKWYEVAPYWIRGGENDQSIGHILVKLKTWENLSLRKKRALERAGSAYWEATVKAYKKEFDFVNNMVHDGKLIEVRIDEAAEEAFTKAAHKIWEDAARVDETSARLILLLKKWHGLE
jgi:TRAP-type C4-dicarboxylate transport system substrate-binding protein